MISTYSRSLPLLSLHLRYMTEASTLAGEKVLGSFNSEITLSKMVLEEKQKGEGQVAVLNLQHCHRDIFSRKKQGQGNFKTGYKHIIIWLTNEKILIYILPHIHFLITCILQIFSEAV